MRSFQFPGISWNLGSERDVKKNSLKERMALGGMHREGAQLNLFGLLIGIMLPQ